MITQPWESHLHHLVATNRNISYLEAVSPLITLRLPAVQCPAIGLTRLYSTTLVS
jgi:hypothetical protein